MAGDEGRLGGGGSGGVGWRGVMERQRGGSIHKASTSLIKCDTALWADDSLLIRDVLFRQKR